MSRNRQWGRWAGLAAAALLTTPGLYLRFQHISTTPLVEAIAFGMAIVGGAFLLAWGTEVAQMEVPQALAIAALAVIAVLPEYAVDMYFAWKAGQDPQYSHYAIANMTGANRLLIGIGWSAVVLLSWVRSRAREVTIEKHHSVEVAFLAVATLYVLIIPIKGSLSLWDSAVLMALFGLYIWMASRMGVEETALAGPPAAVAELPKLPRRLVTALLFLFPGAVILSAAEPFAESLLHLGQGLGIDEFIMVQWLAPLASEAPEMVIASIFALQGKAMMAFMALLSSKVNQWTLLVGTLPVVYSFSLGSAGALPLDARQAQEVLLTAAQSAFAVALLLNFRLTMKGAWVLFLLFISQTFFPHPAIRYGYTFLYLGLAAFFLLRDRRYLGRFGAGLRSALARGPTGKQP